MSQTKAQLIDNLVQPITGALGSAAAPTFSFTADPNTGLFSPGADAVALATAGTNRLHITSGGLVGIGTTSPGVSLEVAGPTGDNLIATFRSGDTTAANNAGGGFRSISSATATSRIAQVWLDADGANLSGGDYFIIQKNGNSGTVEFNQFASAAMTFKTGDIERARIDSSGRLLVGTSSARAFGGLGTTSFQQESTGYEGASASWTLNQNTGDSPWLILAKSRGTSLGSFTVVNSGDALGRISFQGADGSVFRQGASILAEADAAWSSGDAPGRLVFSTTADGASSPTERMRISSAGWVSLKTGTNSIANAGNIYLNPDGNATNVPFIGVGGASSSNSDVCNAVYSTSLSQYQFYVGYGGTVYARSTSISSLSDQREKQNIQDLDAGLSEILALRPRRFDWKDGSGQHIAGFIAQEVELVLPDLVEDYQFNESETRKSLKMGDMIPALVKAIQEQQAVIAELQAKVAVLESA